MANYTQHNLTDIGRKETSAMSKMLSTFADMFVFLLTGIAMVVQWDGVSPLFTMITLILCFVGRAAAVYPLSAFINGRVLLRRWLG